MRNPTLYLKDILEAMEAIEKFVLGVDFVTFKNDDMRSSAVIRKLEIIGEATTNLPVNITLKYPQIPWKDMAGMRDRLIHFYFGVKYDLLWNTIKTDIPRIKPLIYKILNDFKGE